MFLFFQKVFPFYLAYLCYDRDRQRGECTRVACCAFLWFLFINNRKKKPFCFFVVSLLFPSFLLLARLLQCVCVCVLSFIFSCKKTRETESKHCLLARSRVFAASLSPSRHPLLVYYYYYHHHHTSRLLLIIIIYVLSYIVFWESFYINNIEHMIEITFY